jgi:pyruvate formate lyase activating enzyme
MIDTARKAKERGLLNLWITCGYIAEEPLRKLCRVIDAANVDLKGYSERFYRTYCGARLAPVLRTLEILREEGVWVEVTNLVVPDANDSEGMLRDLCRFVSRRLGPGTPLHFSRFHPDFKLLDRSPTPVKTLLRAREIAGEEGLRYVYIGNAPFLDAENTVCHACGTVLVVRRGYDVERNLLRGGACPRCGHRVPGIWDLPEAGAESGDGDG